jgi:hypothetical protein
VEKNWLPAVVTMGVRETCTNMARVWCELASDAVVLIMDKRTMRKRGWIMAELENGCQATERVGCEELTRRFGYYLEQARDGFVFEIFDMHTGAVRGYLKRRGPESIERLDAALQGVGRRTRTGRTPLRNILPDETVRPS